MRPSGPVRRPFAPNSRLGGVSRSRLHPSARLIDVALLWRAPGSNMVTDSRKPRRQGGISRREENRISLPDVRTLLSVNVALVPAERNGQFKLSFQPSTALFYRYQD